MAIFSFRPPTLGARRRAPDKTAEWAETRPSGWSDEPDPLHARSVEPGAAPSLPPGPGFARDLTARVHSDDELLGAGWYISSWDLMQGCDVIEGVAIDELPPEWRRKRPRP